MPTLAERLAAAGRAFRAPVTRLPPALPTAPSAAAASPRDVSVDDDALLVARAEAARQRLRAGDAEGFAAALRRELDAERDNRGRAAAAAVNARLDPVLTEAASLLGQLAVQARLLEEGKPVGALDVMALALRLTAVFERLGLAALGAPGQRVAFHADQHQPFGGTSPAPGAVVVIKVPGYRLGERVVRKSLVERG